MIDNTPFDAAFLTQLEALRVHSRRRYTGQVIGERRSPRHGSSTEFVDFRPYAQGDEPRQVDWNIYGRLDRLVVKLFSEERDLCLHLLLDTSASMNVGSPSKLSLAARVCAALGYVALRSHERIALGLLNERMHQVVRPRSGRRQIHELMRSLQDLKGDGNTALGSTVTQYAWQSRSPGVAIIISDLLDGSSADPHAGYREGVGALIARGFEVQVLHVLADEELDPPLDGDLSLSDIERGGDGTTTDITFESRSRAAYLDNINNFCHEAERFCAQRAIPYFRATCSMPVEELILKRLRTRQFLA